MIEKAIFNWEAAYGHGYRLEVSVELSFIRQPFMIDSHRVTAACWTLYTAQGPIVMHVQMTSEAILELGRRWADAYGSGLNYLKARAKARCLDHVVKPTE